MRAIRGAVGAAFGAAALAAVQGGAGAAGAVPFDTVYVFGDSLSDTGRVFELTRGLIPRSPPYFDGRFSNGPVWVERFAPLVGTQPSQSTNFAYGGAETGTLSSSNVPGVLGQVGQFALTGLGAGPGSRGGGIFAVWAGGNDYFNRVATGTDPAPLVAQTVGNITSAVERLAALGGRTFLVPNLPDLGNVPDTRGSDRAALLNGVTAAHNAQLQQAMAALEQRLGVKVIVADVNGLYRAVAANPAAYGFTNAVTPCITGNAATGACANEAQADQTVYWDEIHPTRAAHLLIAQYMQGAVLALNDAAETVAMQPELAFEISRGWHRALMGSVLGSSLGPRTERVEQGALTAFLIGDASWGRLGGNAEQAGFRYDTQVGGVGAEYAVNPSTRVGLSVGVARGHANLDQGQGEVGVTSDIVGLHAVTEAQGFRLAIAGSVAFDHYGDIDRTTGFSFFPNASADTDGRTYGLSVAGGYTAQAAGIAFGPRLGLRYIHSEVDGYSEGGAGPLSLTVRGQNARSLASSVGAEASTSVTLGAAVLEPSLAVAWEHEFVDDPRTVTVTLPGGASNSVRPDGIARDSLVIGAGLSAALGRTVTAAIGYRAQLAGADGHNHALTARVRMRF